MVDVQCGEMKRLLLYTQHAVTNGGQITADDDGGHYHLAELSVQKQRLTAI